ncbi:MAG: 6-phospho-beta-glucosidase [Defluviitaleaceae bacterium]|nr:6-phospho-beta-glucosidase [Defluviitaleaceae bacterium]
MEKGIKITTFGGGSSYTPELVEGFIKRYDKIPLRELWLVDVEEGKEKLEIVGNLAKRMVEKAKLPIEIHLTLDRRKALEGADFVTTQMRVGLLDSRIKDERISIEHGMLGQETNGAGGMFKALRTVPVIMELVKDIQEICPDAWLINFTNPAGIISETIARYTNFKKSVGLCNVPIGMVHGYAKLLGVDPSRVRMEIQGVNHHIFATDIFLDGKSVFEKVMGLYIEEEKNQTMKNIMAVKFSPDLVKGLGALPCSYHNYFFFTEDQMKKQLEEYKKGEVRGEVVKKIETELFELYKDVNLKEKPKQLEERGGALYSDAACNLISSLINDTCDIQYVNVPNRGAITNLPYNSVIEAASVITKEGPKPLAIGELHMPINGMIQMIKSFERLVAAAAIHGDRSAAIAALNINPLCPNDDKANKVFDALLEAHKAYLPQF